MMKKLFEWFSHRWRAQKPTLGQAKRSVHPEEIRDDPKDGIQEDSPILSPDQDAFGIDPFASAIAKSIAAADARNGLVYAINGAWGSGKSSAVNLILYHLKKDEEEGRLGIGSFNPWWFSGTEALTASFFQELRGLVGKSVNEQARESMASIGRRLSPAGALMGGLASLFATPAAGAAVTGGVALFEKLTNFDTSLETEHRKLSAALRDQPEKFLIVLDDIDRLSPDDALQIFKLIKSVGRLPNVIYLLAFDRQLAEAMVAERFPSERASYLDKIIQGAFDLPPPDAEDLRAQLLIAVEQTMGAPPDAKSSRFWNLFHDVVAPVLKAPRDAVRLGNAIRVSWPAISEDADRADYLALEAIRLFHPNLYSAIRANPSLLTGQQAQDGHNREDIEARYNRVFLDGVQGEERERFKTMLRRLFPRLDAIWANVWHGGAARSERDRLVSSPTHFPTYFAFGVTNNAITARESRTLVENAGTAGATSAALREYLKTPGRRGGTRAALALNELQTRAAEIPDGSVPQLLADLFEVADDLEVPADAGRGFADYGSNGTRIHWVLNVLLLERFDIAVRSGMIRNAAQSAGLSWLVSLARRCKSIKDDRGTPEDQSYENPADDATVDWLVELAGQRLMEAAQDGSLVDVPDLTYMLFRWRDFSDAGTVRLWTDEVLEDDRFIVAVCRSSIQVSWSHGFGGFGSLGDRTTQRTEYVHLAPLAPLLDIERFRGRVEGLLGRADLEEDSRSVLRHFLNTPDRDPELA